MFILNLLAAPCLSRLWASMPDGRPQRSRKMFGMPRLQRMARLTQQVSDRATTFFARSQYFSELENARSCHMALEFRAMDRSQ